jgi:hypothetical protein
VVSVAVLSGRTIFDKLRYHTSRPRASRVIGRSHLEGLKAKDMTGYLKHHLNIAGITEQLLDGRIKVYQLFSGEAILAPSGFRRAVTESELFGEGSTPCRGGGDHMSSL